MPYREGIGIPQMVSELIIRSKATVYQQTAVVEVYLAGGYFLKPPLASPSFIGLTTWSNCCDLSPELRTQNGVCPSKIEWMCILRVKRMD